MINMSLQPPVKGYNTSKSFNNVAKIVIVVAVDVVCKVVNILLVEKPMK